MIAVVPRYPDSDGPLGGPPKRLGQLRAIETIGRVAPGRFGVFNLENRAGTPIYVHAKICIIDDIWFTCGSDNFNRRSWTTDSELTCAVIDTTAGQGEQERRAATSRPLPHALRLQLWAEHLGLDQSDPRLQDPAAGLKLWNAAADALDQWHETGSRPPRPKGHVRHHSTEPVTRLQRLWADPVNRLLVDPDGRPRKIRGTTRF